MSIIEMSSNQSAAYIAKTSAIAKTTSSNQTTASSKEVEQKALVDSNKIDGYKASDKQSINKMSIKERADLVQQLKADAEKREEQFKQTIMKMMGQQGETYAKAHDLWKFIASGAYTVDEETKLQAQEDIKEDGYWGVNKTAERIFDFAQALAGDDPKQMKVMQVAFEKGFKEAAAMWGKDLPELCSQTRDAVNKKFEDYFTPPKEDTVESPEEA